MYKITRVQQDDRCFHVRGGVRSRRPWVTDSDLLHGAPREQSAATANKEHDVPGADKQLRRQNRP